MKKHLINFIIISIFSVFAQAQVSIVTDNFDNPSNWSLNTVVGAPVNSVVPSINFTSPGGTATEDNRWIINNVYSNSTYSCLGSSINASSVEGQPIDIPNAKGNYLHMIQHCAISANQNGASWHSSLANKKKFFAAMNYDFNTSGYYSVNFSFWSYDSKGVSVYYSTNGGSTWTLIDELEPTNLWVKQYYKNTAFDNKATLRFGFLWDDIKGDAQSAPSVDAVEISVPLLECNYYSDKNTLCAAYKETVSFTNKSLPEDQGITYNWTISPGSVGTDWQFVESTNASSKNPKIQFNTPNTYTVRLTTSRAKTSESLFKEKTIQVIDGCQCVAGGGTEILIDETGKSLNSWSSNWVKYNSANGDWQNTPQSSNFNASADAGAYLRLAPFQQNGSYADLTWNQDLDFANSNATYTLTFSISNQAYSSYQNQLRIFVSTDGGQSWPGTAHFTHNTNTGATWVAQTVDLSSFKGSPNVRVRIRGTRSLGGFAGAWDMGLKNVVLTKESSSGGTGDDPTAEIALTSGSNPSCEGESLTFTCTASNIGTYNVTQYIWYVDGLEVQSGPSSIYTSSTILDGQSVSCAIMLNDPSCSGPYTSLPITVLVTPKLTPSVWIKAEPGGYVCEGENMTFTAIHENGGTAPTFQWTLNGNVVSTDEIYSSSQLKNEDKIKITMISDLACVTTQTVDFVYTHHQHDTTNITIQNDAKLCEETEINFTAVASNGIAPYNYQWYLNGNPVGNDSVLTLDDLTSGDEIYIVVNSQTSCDGKSNTLVIQSNSFAPTSAMVSPDNFCSGAESDITLTYDGGLLGIGASAMWYDDQGLTNSVGKGDSLTIASPSATTTYYLVFLGDCNSTDPIDVTLDVYPLPVLNCPDDMLVPMQSPEFELEVTPSGGTYSGIGVTGNMFDPNLPEGTYTITYEYTDSNSCFNLCTFDIAIFEGAMAPEADFEANEVEICEDEAISFTDLSTNEPIEWSWIFEGGSPVNSTEQNPIVTYHYQGVYSVTLIATNKGGSGTETKTMYITVKPKPQYTITHTDESCRPAHDGTITIMYESDLYTILWNTGETDFTFNSLAPGKYSFIITDTNLCSDTGSVVIRPGKTECNPPDVFIPSSFSPNNDGINDLLIIRGHSIKTMEFTIFNRWGNQVFTTTELSDAWDGKINGNYCDPGTYTYYLRATYTNNRKTEKVGIITLIR